MNVWGTGNFENTLAVDFLDNFIEAQVNVIKQNLNIQTINSDSSFLELHGTSMVMPAIAIIIGLHKQLHASLTILEKEDIKQWKQLYLQGWESEIDYYFHPENELRIENRQIIEATFDELILLCGQDSRRI